MKSWIQRLRSLRPAAAPKGQSRRNRPLALEPLETRWCPSRVPSYAFVTSYANDSVMRYDELTGAPAPGPGLTDAYFIRSGSSPMTSPLFAIQAPNGDLIVDSAEDDRIYRYDGTTGAYFDNFENFGGSLSHPTGMVFSPDGQYFYVLSSANNQVIRFDYDGTHAVNPITLVDSSNLAGIPVGAVFGPDGNLYVSTLTTNAVLRYDPINGTPLPGPNQSGANFITPGDGDLNMGGGIVFGPDGNLYVANQVRSDILRFNGTDGTPLPADGQSGATFVPPGELNDPAGMVFGPGTAPCSQDLYVVSINTNTVQHYDGTTGAYDGDFVPTGVSALNKPRGMTFSQTNDATLNFIPHGGHYHLLCGGIANQTALPPAGKSTSQVDNNLVSLAVTPAIASSGRAPVLSSHSSVGVVSAVSGLGGLADELVPAATTVCRSVPGIAPVHTLGAPQRVASLDVPGQDGLELI